MSTSAQQKIPLRRTSMTSTSFLPSLGAAASKRAAATCCVGYCFCGQAIPPSRRPSTASTSSARSSATPAPITTRQRRINSASSCTSQQSAGSSSSAFSEPDSPYPLTPANGTVDLPTLPEDGFQKQLDQRLSVMREDDGEEADDEDLDDDEDDEEPRIYCSSACARSDALSALLAGSKKSPAQPRTPPGSILSSDGPSQPPALDRPAARTLRRTVKSPTSKRPSARAPPTQPIPAIPVGVVSAATAAIEATNFKHPFVANAPLYDAKDIFGIGAADAHGRKAAAVNMLQKLNSKREAGGNEAADPSKMERILQRASLTLSQRYPELMKQVEIGSLFNVKALPGTAAPPSSSAAQASGSSHYRRMEALASSSCVDIVSLASYGASSPCHSEDEHDQSFYPDSPLLHTEHGHDGQRSQLRSSTGHAASSRKYSHTPMESTSSSSSGSSATTQASVSTAATSVSGDYVPMISEKHGRPESYVPSRQSVEERELEIQRDRKLKQELMVLDRELKKTFDAFGELIIFASL